MVLDRVIAVSCFIEDGANELLDGECQRPQSPIAKTWESITALVAVGVGVALEAVEHFPEVVLRAEAHDLVRHGVDARGTRGA